MRKKNLYIDFIIISIFLVCSIPVIVNGGTVKMTIFEIENGVLTRLYLNLARAEAVFENVQEQARLLKNTLISSIGQRKFDNILNSINAHLDEWDVRFPERTETTFNARMAEEVAYLERKFKSLRLTSREKNLFIQHIEAERYAQRVSGAIGEFKTNIAAINDFIRTLSPSTSRNVSVEIDELIIRVRDVPPLPQSLPRSPILLSPPPSLVKKVLVDVNDLADMRNNINVITVVVDEGIDTARRALTHTNRELAEFIESERLGDAVRQYYDEYNQFIPKLPQPSDVTIIAKNKNKTLTFIDRLFKNADFLRDMPQFLKQSLKDYLKNEIKIQAFIDEEVMIRRSANEAMQKIALAISSGRGANEISMPEEIMKIVRNLQRTDIFPDPPLVLRDFMETERMALHSFGGRLNRIDPIPTAGRFSVPRPSVGLREEGLSELRRLAQGDIPPEVLARWSEFGVPRGQLPAAIGSLPAPLPGVTPVQSFSALPPSFQEAEKSGKLKSALQWIAKELTRQRTPYSFVSKTIKAGGTALTIIGRIAAGGQIMYEFTVFDENAQKTLSDFSVLSTPHQIMELLGFPEQQVAEVREIAAYSPLHELSRMRQKRQAEERGDFSQEKKVLAQQIYYLEQCLHNRGTAQVCVLKHDLPTRVIDTILGYIFSEKTVLPPHGVLYLNNPASIKEIERRIQYLEEKEQRLIKKEEEIRERLIREAEEKRHALSEERIQKLSDRLRRGEYAPEPLIGHQY